MKKPISTPAGATPEEWQYLEMLSPADRACVLPIVSNSKIPAIGGLVHSDKRGKIPSVLTCKNGGGMQPRFRAGKLTKHLMKRL